MQLIVPTAKLYAKPIGLALRRRARSSSPRSTSRSGSRGLAELQKTFSSTPLLAIPGYNAGPNRPRRWARERPHADFDFWVELIPISETRRYTKRVLASRAAYAYLYDKDTAPRPWLCRFVWTERAHCWGPARKRPEAPAKAALSGMATRVQASNLGRFARVLWMATCPKCFTRYADEVRRLRGGRRGASVPDTAIAAMDRDVAPRGDDRRVPGRVQARRGWVRRGLPRGAAADRQAGRHQGALPQALERPRDGQPRSSPRRAPSIRSTASTSSTSSASARSPTAASTS